MSERVPEGWKISSLSKITRNFDSVRVPVKSTDRQGMQGMFRYYGASGIIDYVDDYLFDGTYILLGEDGENVISRNLPLAFIVSGKFWVNNHAHIFQPVDEVDIQFLCEFLESLDYSNIASGSAQPKITKSSLNEINVALPPLPEQKKIASIITSVDEVIETTQKQIDKIHDLKKATMNELLTKGIGHTEFKDSELGRIPKSWEVKSLRSFVLDQIGGASLTPSDFSKEGFPVIPKKAVQFGGRIILGNKRTYCRHEFSQANRKNIVNSQYVITTLRDLVPTGPTIGLVGVLDELGEFILAQGVYGFSLSDQLNPLYLSFVSNTDWYRSVMRNIFVGSTQIHIRGGDFLNVLIPVPSIDEQQDIVRYIDNFETAISLAKQRRQKLLSFKKSLMQDLLTGKVRVQVN